MHLSWQIDVSEYISPPGSREYIEASKAFEDAAIKVQFDFYPPAYSQLYGELPITCHV